MNLNWHSSHLVFATSLHFELDDFILWLIERAFLWATILRAAHFLHVYQTLLTERRILTGPNSCASVIVAFNFLHNLNHIDFCFFALDLKTFVFGIAYVAPRIVLIFRKLLFVNRSKSMPLQKLIIPEVKFWRILSILCFLIADIVLHGRWLILYFILFWQHIYAWSNVALSLHL